MKNSQINQVIKLVKRTGDRVVIMDNESDSVMVLLDLKNYERLLESDLSVENLSEEELLEKINREVGVWRSYNGEGDSGFDPENFLVDELEGNPEEDAFVPPEDHAEINSTEESIPETLLPREDNINVEELAGEKLAEPQEEEEKFYLEPVE